MTGVESETDTKTRAAGRKSPTQEMSWDDEKKERTIGEQSDQTAKPYIRRNSDSQKSEKKWVKVVQESAGQQRAEITQKYSNKNNIIELNPDKLHVT